MMGRSADFFFMRLLYAQLEVRTFWSFGVPGQLEQANFEPRSLALISLRSLLHSRTSIANRVLSDQQARSCV